MPRREYGHRDVQKAMKDEIEKYNAFNAFEEVIDEGQDSLPVRWVFLDTRWIERISH